MAHLSFILSHIFIYFEPQMDVCIFLFIQPLGTSVSLVPKTL